MNQTITSGVDSIRSSCLYEAFQKKRQAQFKRKGIILLHDNARLHVEKVTFVKFKAFKLDALMFPFY